MSSKRKVSDKSQDNSVPPKKKSKVDWECQWCHKRFLAANKQRHLDSHFKAAYCPFCDYLSSRCDALERHIDTKHADTPLHCKYCEAEIIRNGGKVTVWNQFPDSKTLAQHIWKHHPSKAIPPSPIAPISTPQPTAAAANTEHSPQTHQVSGTSNRLVDYSDSESDSGDGDEQDADMQMEMVPSSDEDDDDLLTDPLLLMPQKTLRGPPKDLLAVTDQPAPGYNTYNEQYNSVPRTVLDSVLQGLDEDAHPYIKNNWRSIRSFMNLTVSSMNQHYNRRLIGNDDGVTLGEYFRQQVHGRQRNAYRVQAAVGYLLQNTEDEDEYKVYTAQQNHNAITIKPMSDNDNGNVSKTENNHASTPFLIKDEASLEHFIEHLDHEKLVNTTTRDSTKWRLVAVLNAHFWVTQLPDRPIGWVPFDIPKYLRKNRHLKTFTYDAHRNRYKDRLCLFRVISYKLDNNELLEDKVEDRFHQWAEEHSKQKNIKKFKGVPLSQLDTIEDMFNVSFSVYQRQEDGTVYLLRRGVECWDSTHINVDLHISKQDGFSHFSLIKHLEKYGKKWFCKFCDGKFTRSNNLAVHMKRRNCTRGIPKKHFPGGVHQEPLNIFEDLELLGIEIPKIDKDGKEIPRYNQYFCVHDYESLLEPIEVAEDGKSLTVTEGPTVLPPAPGTEADQRAFEKHQLPTKEPLPNGKTKKLQFFQAHQPISFAILSNVPGYAEKPFFHCNGDPEILVETYLNHLEAIAEKRKELIMKDFAPIVNKLTDMYNTIKQKIAQKKEEQKLKDKQQQEVSDNNNGDNNKNKKNKVYTPMEDRYLKKVESVLNRLESWIDQLPVIGFNSSKYDIPLIKDYLYPMLVRRARENVDLDTLHAYDRRIAKLLKIPIHQTAKKKTNDNVDDEPNGNFDMEAVEVDAESDSEEEEEGEQTKGSDIEAEEEEEEGDQVAGEESSVEEDETLPSENRKIRIKGMPTLTKKGNAIICIRTDTLLFLDMSLYLAAGTSLDKFQRAWMKADENLMKKTGEEDKFGMINLVKLPFPYEFLDNVKKLDYQGVPEQKEFFSHLKGKNISDEDYNLVNKLYQENNIVYFKDYLKLYNEMDVKPFLQACQKQFMQYFKETGIDMFKECISLPGITLKYLHKTTSNYQFALWNREDAELHQEIRNHLTGGVSMVMTRYAEAGKTIIRGDEYADEKSTRPKDQFYGTKCINGYDANALYLWAVAQEMPSGFHTLWELNEYSMNLIKKRDAKPQAAQWLQFKADQDGCEIINKYSHGFEQRLGFLQIPVDGFRPATKPGEKATVYEYLGCYWHCHGHHCKHHTNTEKNEKIGKDSKMCLEELMARKVYIESLGMNFEFKWECDWLEERKQPAVVMKLVELNRKFAMFPQVPYKRMVKAIKRGTVFGFVKVDMETPEELQKLHHFRDFPPIIKNMELTRDHLSPLMKKYAEDNHIWEKPVKSLVSGFKAEGQWMLTSMVAYLISKGVKLTKIHKVVQYDQSKPFKWFADKVTQARSAADKDEAMEILGQAFKLLGNTAYGKTITDLERHTEVYIVTYEMAREIAHDPFLVSIEPIANTDCFEAVLRKRKINFNLPEQIGIAMYNWAKIKMFQFAYDVLGKFCDPYKYSWMQTDTDSCYIQMAGDTIDDILKEGMAAEWEAEKGKWLVQRAEDKRTPGLFKLEYKGTKMVCLCCKTYKIIGADGGSKSATKGLNKSSDIEFEQFKRVLNTGISGKGFNTGFQKHGKTNRICTYICERTALSNFYGKRRLHDDKINTGPLYNV